MRIKKILVPVDYSEISDRAVKYALSMAQQLKASVTLLHVVVLFKDDVDDEEQLKNYEEIVEKKEIKRSQKMRSHQNEGVKKGVKVNSLLIRGISAAETILNYIAGNKFDLVIMGTHGRTGVSKWFFGSVAERVVRHSTVPLLTIHREYRKTQINKILVPIDFSKFAKKAVQTGIQLSKDFKSKIIFLHSIEQESHPEFYANSLESILKVNPRLKNRIHANMIKFTGVKEDKAKYIIKEGKAYKEIKKYAKNNGVGLIVMASRGLGFWDQVLIGSNVAAVAHCPVLTVRGK